MAKINKKSKQKMKSSSTTKFVGIILTVFSVFVVANLVVQLNTYAQLKSEKEKIESRIAEENKKKEDYNNQMEYFSTDEYIEKIAREQLGLVMPDEIVFKINND